MMSPDMREEFLGALVRLSADFAEALQLARREPASLDDWRRGFAVQNETWQRMGETISELSVIVVGKTLDELVAEAERDA